MEPPHKRQRLSRRKIPDVALQIRKARNDNRLKSIFESIFDKFGKDFDGIGDEIDLRTGEIVVNNGHLLGLRNHGDAGQMDSSPGEFEIELSSDEEGEGEQEDGQEFDEGTAAAVLHNPSMNLGRSLHGQIINYDSEEDELADRAIEWTTPREARATAFRKWQLPVDGPAFTDNSLIEEAWRAPPLHEHQGSSPSLQEIDPNKGLHRELSPMNLQEVEGDAAMGEKIVSREYVKDYAESRDSSSRECADQIMEHARVVASQDVVDDAVARTENHAGQINNIRQIFSSKEGLLPQAEVGGGEVTYHPTSDNVANVRPHSCSSTSHRTEIAFGMPAQENEKPRAAPAYLSQDEISSMPSARPAQESSLLLLSPAMLDGAPKPERHSIAIADGISYVVQVRVPQHKPHEDRGPKTSTKPCVVEETLQSSIPEDRPNQQRINLPISCELNVASNGPDEALLASEAVHGLEVPDSQPEFSSPIRSMEQMVDSLMVEAESPRATSPLACQTQKQAKKQPDVNYEIPESEFDDELSVVTLRPKRQFGIPATFPAVSPERTKIAPPLNSQIHKQRNAKPIPSSASPSLASFALDIFDWSEDELSLV